MNLWAVDSMRHRTHPRRLAQQDLLAQADEGFGEGFLEVILHHPCRQRNTGIEGELAEQQGPGAFGDGIEFPVAFEHFEAAALSLEFNPLLQNRLGLVVGCPPGATQK